MKNVYSKINEGITKFESWFLIISFATMGVIMAFQVFSRAIFGHSIVWSEELTRHIFIWSTFIGMSYGVGRSFHINLDYFTLKIPQSKRIIVSICMDIALFVSLVILFRTSLIYVQDQMEITGPTTGYPMGIVMMSMPLSCVLACIHLIGTIAAKFQSIQKRTTK